MNGDLAVGKRDWEDYRWKEIFAKVSLNENTMSGFNMPRHCRNFRFQLIDDKIDEERGSISEKPGRSSLIKPSTAKKTHLKCHRCAAWQKEGSNFFFTTLLQQCHCPSQNNSVIVENSHYDTPTCVWKPERHNFNHHIPNPHHALCGISSQKVQYVRISHLIIKFIELHITKVTADICITFIQPWL